MRTKRSCPMSRAELDAFVVECHRRSRTLRRDTLKHHQRYPPMFVRTTNPVRREFPAWFRRRVAPCGQHFVARIQTIDDLHVLSSMTAQVVCLQHGLRQLRPTDGAEYFRAIGDPAREDQWQKEWFALLKKWPTVPPDSIAYPAPTPEKRAVVLYRRAPDAPGGWELCIRVTDDTTDADLAEAWRLAKRIRGPIQRRRPPSDVAQKLLNVFDAYRHHRSFPRVARLLRLPESTVRRLYPIAAELIEGHRPIKRRRRHTLSTMELRRQLRMAASWETDCAACASSGRLCPAHVEEFERSTRALEGGRRDRLTRTGDIERLAALRRR